MNQDCGFSRGKLNLISVCRLFGLFLFERQTQPSLWVDKISPSRNLCSLQLLTQQKVVQDISSVAVLLFTDEFKRGKVSHQTILSIQTVSTLSDKFSVFAK